MKGLSRRGFLRMLGLTTAVVAVPGSGLLMPEHEFAASFGDYRVLAYTSSHVPDDDVLTAFRRDTLDWLGGGVFRGRDSGLVFVRE